MPADRTVHAWGDSGEVVRYDRAGKWYFEPKDGPRRLLGVSDAAIKALWLWYHDNGSVNFGLAGGGMFDQMVRDRSGA
jgi:hypothetical protein